MGLVGIYSITFIKERLRKIVSNAAIQQLLMDKGIVYGTCAYSEVFLPDAIQWQDPADLMAYVLIVLERK